jgi:ATP-dependent DNA helicase RecQ
VIELLPHGVPVLCTTATANDRVIDDVSEQLGEELVTLRGSLDRESLVLAAADMPSQADRLAWLAQTIPKLDGSGIVYVLTVADTDRVAEFLQLHGISAEAYSGATDAELRPELEQRLLDNDVKALVATSALGMGFDKPNLGFVIHFQSPGSPIAYYQQVGRAGRSLERAPAILLHGTEDRDIQNYFIETAFPTKRQAGEVLGLLAERAAPMSLAQIEAEVNVRRGRLQQMLKILEVEGAVQRDGSRYQRTLVLWEYPAERVERITELRRQEQDAMEEYVHHDGCLMEFLRKELDDPDAAPCGRCAGCTGEPLDVSVDPELRGAALEFLRGSPLMLQARLQWPSGVEGVKGKISEEERLEVGRVLSVLSDGGWGGLVRRGRDEDEHFDDALVDASAAFVGGRWKPDPPPEWVTCVPSMMHPDLVPDFARRLAEKLGLPFLEVIRKVAENQPQNRMENSAQQFRNVWEAFEVKGEVPSGPALLVDDISDSRWTLTVIGRELRLAGCKCVYPFVLAKAVSG